MKLSDLSALDQRDIILQRIENTKAFHSTAFKSRDPIVMQCLELELQAAQYGIDTDYTEELSEEDCI